MLKVIEKEIKKLENAKERKTKSKTQLEKDLIEIEQNLKELTAQKVKVLKVQEELNAYYDRTSKS